MLTSNQQQNYEGTKMRSTKKIFAQGKMKLQKNHARQLSLKNIHAMA